VVAPRTMPSQHPNSHDRQFRYVWNTQGTPERLGLAEMGQDWGNCLHQTPIFLSAVSAISFVHHDCSPVPVSFAQRRYSNKTGSGNTTKARKLFIGGGDRELSLEIPIRIPPLSPQIGMTLELNLTLIHADTWKALSGGGWEPD